MGIDGITSITGGDSADVPPEQNEVRHFSVGPRVTDALCGIDGELMTHIRSRVTCTKCKEIRDGESGPVA